METPMNFLSENQASVEAVRKVISDERYAHAAGIAEMGKLDDAGPRPEAYDHDDSIWDGPLVEENHHGIATRFPALETRVDEKDNGSAKADSGFELKRYSKDPDKTAEIVSTIIERIEDSRNDFKKKIEHNLELRIAPILEQLKFQEMSEAVSSLLRLLEFDLADIFSSFGVDMGQRSHLLTTNEMHVCDMIRYGLSSKQVAKIMGVSCQTVHVHRKNARKKLGLTGSKKNLSSFLQTNPLPTSPRDVRHVGGG